MRLLLDEHFSKLVAQRLRDDHGHDVVAVTERPELVGLQDAALWEVALAEGRALVTENAADFLLLVHAATASGSPHPGLIVTSHRAFPRSKAASALLVTALDALRGSHRSDDALVDRVVWLGSPNASRAAVPCR